MFLDDPHLYSLLLDSRRATLAAVFAIILQYVSKSRDHGRDAAAEFEQRTRIVERAMAAGLLEADERDLLLQHQPLLSNTVRLQLTHTTGHILGPLIDPFLTTVPGEGACDACEHEGYRLG